MRAPLGNRGRECSGIEAGKSAFTKDRHRDGTKAARDEIVVRAVVFVNVVRRKRHAFS
jgi:hypothetical protein